MKITLLLKLWLVLTIILSVSACTFLQSHNRSQPSVEIIPDHRISLPSPSTLPFNIKATQVLTATYHIKDNVKHYSSQVEVRKNHDKLVMVALGGWGSELFSLTYQGDVINISTLPMPDINMGAKYALTDFIITYAPKQVIQTMFKHSGITPEITPYQRNFYFEGRKIISIHYDHADPWQAQITIDNHQYNYTIHIKTISIKPIESSTAS